MTEPRIVVEFGGLNTTWIKIKNEALKKCETNTPSSVECETDTLGPTSECEKVQLRSAWKTENVEEDQSLDLPQILSRSDDNNVRPI